ncbi:hypothetical protein FQN60_016793, partial [Etheostoma spectabile]
VCVALSGYNGYNGPIVSSGPLVTSPTPDPERRGWSALPPSTCTMSAFKKRSSFQITSVTSDLIQSAASVAQGSSSQPTTPCLKRRYGSHDATGQGSRFRVVRLAAAGGRGQTSRRGRWTCTDVMETQDGCSRVMDSMRHAHSLESLELIGRDADGGGAYSQHYMLEPIRGGVHSQQPIRGFRAGPPPTPPGPNVRILATPGFDFAPPPPLPRPRNIPPPLRLDVDSAGRDLVKSHLMLAVREEVELLRDQIRDLQEKNQQLQRENHILRTLTHNLHNT